MWSASPSQQPAGLSPPRGEDSQQGPLFQKEPPGVHVGSGPDLPGLPHSTALQQQISVTLGVLCLSVVPLSNMGLCLPRWLIIIYQAASPLTWPWPWSQAA